MRSSSSYPLTLFSSLPLSLSLSLALTPSVSECTALSVFFYSEGILSGWRQSAQCSQTAVARRNLRRVCGVISRGGAQPPGLIE